MTSGLTLVIANLFDLASISMMGSAGFLIVFAAVNGANVVRHAETKSRRAISATGAVACVSALAALVFQSTQSDPRTLWVLTGLVGASVGLEASYRAASGRRRRRHLPTRAAKS